MADVKPIKMQKRRAMGESGITGMKKGGAVRESPKPMKGGGKMSKKGC